MQRSVSGRTLVYLNAVARDCRAVEDTIKDTTVMIPYYNFIQYYDSCRVLFQFGEVQWHRYGGVVHDVGLYVHNWNENRPFSDNSLSGIYNVSGSGVFSYNVGDTISYFVRQEIMPENEFIFNPDVKDTVIYYIEMLNVDQGVVVDTVDYFGFLPYDSVMNQPRWIHGTGDTATIKRFIIPDYGYSDAPRMQLKIRPTFQGSPDRLGGISRWDYLRPTPVSEGVIEVKAHLIGVLNAYMDSMSRKSYREEVESKTDDFTVIPTTATHTVSIMLPSKLPISSIRIFDVHGQERKRVSTSDSYPGASITVSVSDLPSGRYFVAITDHDRILSVRSFGVRK
jgi:hypothetical protein